MNRAKDVAIIVLLVAIAYLLGTRDQIESSDDVSGKTSIAVLPFVSLGAHGEELLSDRIRDDTLTRLAKNPELRVLTRSSVSAYRGTDQSPESVGRELDVAFIVEGAVRTGQDRARITAQLIRVDDGAHLWSAGYDVTGKHINEISSEIAASVSREIGTSQ